MFTGLIEDIGQIVNIKEADLSRLISVKFNIDLADVKIGDSFSINGACQTVIQKNENVLTFEVMRETLKRTDFKNLKTGDYVNMERAMQLNSRLNGHIVTGHIDTTAVLKEIKEDGIAKIFRFACDTDLIVEKGSISINGISLTVSKVSSDWFEVSILPYTLNHTNLGHLKQNSCVNIEFDTLAKYIKKFFVKEPESKITKEFLIENGF